MQQHRDPLGEEQGGQEVALLLLAQGQHGYVVGGAFDAAVPGPVVALAVPVVLPVGLVVLLVVGHQVVQGEPVVGGDEVDRGDRAPTVVLVEVAGPGEPETELAEGGRLAPPEVAHRVAVLAVPLRPQRREAADHVATLTQVPRLGDELDLGHHRVLLDEVEERGQPVHLVELPGQRGGQVEAEAVDVHLQHPVAQRVHDELQHVRVAHEQAVAGPGGVEVQLRLVVDEPVVGAVVDAPEAQGGAELVAFGGVVVDDVEDDLDARLVQRANQGLELQHLLATLPAGGVGVVRCEEADRVVAPVVGQAPLDQVVVLHELVHRHQLHGGDAEPAQVLDHGRVGQPRVGAADRRGDVRVVDGQALDVGLVDDRLVVGGPRVPVVLPVEEGVGDDGLHHVGGAVLVVAPVRPVELVAEDRLVPVDLALDRLGVRVEEQLAGVAAQPLGGRVGPVHPEAVPLARGHPREVAVPDEPVDLGEVHPLLVPRAVEQAYLDPFGDLGEHGEVGPRAVEAGP